MTFIDLHQPPGLPSSPPVWEDIERLALSYPVLQHAVTLVHRGDVTREQALIAAVFALAHSVHAMTRAEINRRNREIPSVFIMEREP